MVSDELPDQQLEADLRLIDALRRVLEKEPHSTFQTARDEFAKIAELVKNPSCIGRESALQLLPAFMASHPELFRRTILEHADETLAFITGVCDHYRTIKQQRPLTPEEKSIGGQLNQLLDLVRENLGLTGDTPHNS